jgi:flagellar motility protein MotE (MotC chaperone)
MRRLPALGRPRLIPVLIAGIGLLMVVKLGGSAADLLGPMRKDEAPMSAARPSGLIGAAQAQAQAPAQPPAQPQPAAAPPAPSRPAPAPAIATAPAPPPETTCDVQRTDAAERALLEQLRGRRAEIEAREQAAAEREVLIAASERRLTERVDNLAALQARIEAAEQARSEREEQGWRQMVKLYEGMRPREAAAIFEELEMPVLLQILARMGERKAAPVLGAMRPERARQVTAELARHRASSPIN